MLMQKAVATIFILITVSSVFLTSYNVFLLFGAYDVGRLLNVSLSNVEVLNSSSGVSVKLYFSFTNPSKFALKLVYAAAFVYVNSQTLTPSYAPATLVAYDQPVLLSPLSENVSVTITAFNVRSEKIPQTSERMWFVKLQFMLYDVPLTGRGVYTFLLHYEEG